MTEQRAVFIVPNVPDRTATCGALGADISKAVEIISVRHQILGSAAYRLLGQAAKGAHVTVREMACVVVSSTNPSKQDTA